MKFNIGLCDGKGTQVTIKVCGSLVSYNETWEVSIACDNDFCT